MNLYDPYNHNYRDDLYDRPQPGYAYQYPTPSLAAKSSLGKPAALAAVLVGTIGVAAAIGMAVFGHTNSGPTLPTTIVLHRARK